MSGLHASEVTRQVSPAYVSAGPVKLSQLPTDLESSRARVSGVFLRVDADLVYPCRIDEDCIAFRMSTPPRNLRIVSSSVVPAYCNEGEQDRRRLGLPIRQIVLRSDTGHIAIQHDNPWLVEGFHAAEGTHRWTDGYAGVPPHILRCLAGPLTVELYLGARKQLARDILSNNRDEPSPPDPAAPPRALFVDARVPTPDQDAGSNVIYEQMRVVQSLGFAVTFLAPADPALPSKYIDSLHEVGIDIVQTNSELAHERFLQEKGSQFTLAYLHRFDVAERCIALLRFHAPRTVLIFNNADMHFLRMQRQARLTGMAEHLAFAESIKKREMSVSRAVDCTLICNLQEQEILRQEAPDALSHYLPWIIEACIEPLPAYRDRTDLMFIGGFNHPPNLDGVLWFLSEVFPTVQQLLPEVRLHIYGSAIPASLIELASDRVVIGGHVADLAVAFDRHRVSIAPLRFGAGFKGKLAASLAHGVPSVVTPIGAEGTGLNDGEHVLVAEDAVTFAAAIVYLYNNEPLWRRLARSGLQFVREQFSSEMAKRHFREILAKVNWPAQPLETFSEMAPASNPSPDCLGPARFPSGPGRIEQEYIR